MTKIFVVGLCGKVGGFIVDNAAKYDAEVVGGLDRIKHPTLPTFTCADDVNVEFDVIVDFSRPELIGEIDKLARKTGKGVVIATTGYSDAQMASIKALAEEVPVLKSGNMSVGVNLLLDLVEKATKTLYESWDIEIIEKHHNQKVDAPSGTAMMLAEKVKEVKTDAAFKFGREGVSKREAQDVTIHAVRGGTIVGEHDVIFAGNDEVVTLSHMALSRRIFAVGAIRAAHYVNAAKPGYYTMKNAIED